MAADSSASRNSSRGWPRAVLVDTTRMAVLALAALGIGRGLNRAHREPLGSPYRPPKQRLEAAVKRLQPTPGTAAATPSPIDLDAFQAFVSARQGLVIDARTGAFYRQGHVPGAINLPRETFAADYAARKAVLDRRKTDEIAVYCSEADCPDAELVAEALGRLGFQRLHVYRAGWEEWTQAGLPQEGTQPP